jgi:hypothetical protein
MRERPLQIASESGFGPQQLHQGLGCNGDERLPADRGELGIVDSRQQNAEPAQVTHIWRPEEPLRIGFDHLGLDTVRSGAPDRESTVLVMVVEKHHEALLVPDEECRSAVAQAFRGLRQRQACRAHRRERLSYFMLREATHGCPH